MAPSAARAKAPPRAPTALRTTCPAPLRLRLQLVESLSVKLLPVRRRLRDQEVEKSSRLRLGCARTPARRRHQQVAQPQQRSHFRGEKNFAVVSPLRRPRRS